MSQNYFLSYKPWAEVIKNLAGWKRKGKSQEYFETTFSVSMWDLVRCVEMVYIYVKLCNTLRPRMPLGAQTKYIGHNESGGWGTASTSPRNAANLYPVFFRRWGVARIGSRRRAVRARLLALAGWRWHVPLSQHPRAPVYRIGISDCHWNRGVELSHGYREPTARSKRNARILLYAPDIKFALTLEARLSVRTEKREEGANRMRAPGIIYAWKWHDPREYQKHQAWFQSELEITNTRHNESPFSSRFVDAQTKNSVAHYN